MLKFAGVNVATVYMRQQADTRETFCRAEVVVGNRPQVVVLTISVDPLTDVVPLTVFHGEAKELKGSFELRVPVAWNRDAPFTRRKGEDNVDVILLTKDGHFMDIQVSLTTRGGKFYVNAQQVFRGYIVRTRGVKVGEVEYEYVPIDDVHTYPGFNYSTTWGPMADAIVEVAQVERMSSQLSRVRQKLADDREWWRDPMLPIKAGMDQGRVLFFNLVTQTGKIRDKAGDWFVHFSDIDTSEKLLEPMQPVYFRLRVQSGGQTQAVKVTPA